MDLDPSHASARPNEEKNEGQIADLQNVKKFAAPVPFAVGTSERPPVQWIPWAAAGLFMLVLVGGLVLVSQHKPVNSGNAVLSLDSYASNLVISDLQMSESSSLSGGKSTFIDGRIRNQGSRTVAGATVQVLFGNDEALPPQVETLPLTLIRTRTPYIDTQPLGSSPLASGQEREFRLIFENVGTNWNQQFPAVHFVHVSLE